MLTDISQPQIYAISIPIFYTAAVFGLLSHRNVEKVFRFSLQRPDDVVSIIYDVHAVALSAFLPFSW